MLQMRPSSLSYDKRMYAPNRDLAYCFPQLVRMAITGFDDANWEPWLGDYLRQQGITSQEDFVPIVQALGKAFTLFMEADVKSPYEALEQSGFFEQPTAAQIAICAKIAQVTIGAFFVAIRDVTAEADTMPASIADLAKAGDEFASRVTSKETTV